MGEKRRFNRIPCNEKIRVDFASSSFDATILDISLNGALIEFGDDVCVRIGEKFKMMFRLGESNIILQFDAKVVHMIKGLAGARFVKTSFRHNDQAM